MASTTPTKIQTPSDPEFEMRHRMALALEHADVSVTEMAEALDCSPNTVGNYLHGRTKPRTLVLQAWALRCGVRYEWLADGKSVGKDMGSAEAPPKRGKPKRPLKPAHSGSRSGNHSYLQLLDTKSDVKVKPK